MITKRINTPMRFEAGSISPPASADLACLPKDMSPPTPPPSPAPKRTLFTRSRFVAATALSTIFIALCLVATYTPWYREWAFSRAPLQTLQRAAGGPRGGYDTILLYYLGRRLNEQQRFPEADPLLRRAVGLDGNSARLRDEWTRALLGSGLTTAAFGQLKEFVGTHPNSAEAHLILGKFYITQRSMQRAIDELQKSVTLDPTSGEGWANLAVAHNGMGNSGPALAAAQKAVSLRPRDAGDHLRLALLLAVPGSPDTAREAFEETLRLGPNVAEAHQAFASWLMQSGSRPGDIERASAEAEKATRLAPTNGEVFLTLGRVLLQRGKVQEASEPLRRAAKLSVFDPAPPRALAQAARRLGRYDEAGGWEAETRKRQLHVNAKRAVLTAILANPEASGPHRQMARLVAAEGDIEGCVRDHARALRLGLDSAPVLAAAANDLCEAGYAKQALPLAQRATTLAAVSPAAQEALGNALLGTGKAHDAALAYDKACGYWPDKFPVYQKRLEQFVRNTRRAATAAPVALTPAENAYQKSRVIIGSQVGPILITTESERLASEAVALEPKNPRYLRHLFNLQFTVKKVEAIATAKRLLALEPHDARTHALLAVLLVDRAAHPEELAEVQTHLDAASADPAVAATKHYGLGLLALRNKQGAEAVRELKQAAQIDPEPEVTYYKLFLAYQMTGNKAAATKALAQSRRRHAESAAEAQALKKLAENSDHREAFTETAAVFEAHGHHTQAQAIRAAAPSASASPASPKPSSSPAPAAIPPVPLRH